MDILISLGSSIEQSIYFLVVSVEGLFLQGIDQRQCDHALAQIIASRFPYGCLVFCIVQDVIDNLECYSQVQAVFVKEGDFLVRGLAYDSSTFAAGSDQTGRFMADFLIIAFDG